MINRPEIVETTDQHIAFIHVVVDRDKIQTVMGPGIMELRSVVADQKIETLGPWFTHHLKIDPTGFDFQICVIVSIPIAASGRVEPGTWPAMKAARTVYRGSFEGLGDAWQEFNGWVNENGLIAATDLWERYLSGPEDNPDPSTWTTELTRPLL